MLKRTVVILNVMFLVCAVSAQIQSARGEGAPILLSFGGDQWAWDATSPSAKQLTRSGINRSAVLSPDGKWLAYKSTAQFVIDLAKKDGPFLTHGDFPAESGYSILGRARHGGLRSNQGMIPL